MAYLLPPPSDNNQINALRETTPPRVPQWHARVREHLGGDVQSGARGSPAGGRMRATAVEERKKRKESHGGGRSWSLCPRHRRRGTATRPRRRRRGRGLAGRGVAMRTIGGGRRWNIGRRRGECDTSLCSTGWGNLRTLNWWGPPKYPRSFPLGERGARLGRESGVSSPLLPLLDSPLSAVSVSHPLEGFSHLAPAEPRALSPL